MKNKKDINEEKYARYAVLITSQISEMFGDETSNHIDMSELDNSDNLKAFFHALSTVAPCFIFEKFTNEEKNHLEFNQLANQLCFEYMSKK